MLRRWSYVLTAMPMLFAARSAIASEEGEPNLFGGDLVISIVTLLIFGLVIFVLGKFAWGPILRGLQQREKFIRESLESAKHDRESAEARLAEYEEKLRRGREEASALVEEGRRDAEEVRRRLEADARKSAEEITERAKREIGIARDTALRELHERSAELAMMMAGEVLKRQLGPEDHERMVADALKQLRQSGGSGAN